MREVGKGTTLKHQQTWSCNCIGPQNGEPLCPCRMRDVIKKNGRWIKPEQDLGPVLDVSSRNVESW